MHTFIKWAPLALPLQMWSTKPNPRASPTRQPNFILATGKARQKYADHNFQTWNRTLETQCTPSNGPRWLCLLQMWSTKLQSMSYKTVRILPDREEVWPSADTSRHEVENLWRPHIQCPVCDPCSDRDIGKVYHSGRRLIWFKHQYEGHSSNTANMVKIHTLYMVSG